MRPLDLYSEKALRDGSPDKIAASTAFLKEANGLSLSSICSEAQPRRGGGAGGGSSSSGLLSVFTGNVINNKNMRQRDQMALASVAMCNPLMLLGMGATFAIADEMRLARERELGPHNNSNEELYKAGTIRELKKVKAKEEKREATFTPSRDALTLSLHIDDSAAAKKKAKLSFMRDRVSISRGVTMSEREMEPRHTRDWVKANKLLKQKVLLNDYLEKSRGKLDLQTVANLMGQMERLDKALSKYGY